MTRLQLRTKPDDGGEGKSEDVPATPSDMGKDVAGALALDAARIEPSAVHSPTTPPTRSSLGGQTPLNQAIRRAMARALRSPPPKLEVHVAWLGDCRAVLCRGGEAVALTQDHKASRPDEMERIRQAGGIVDHKGRLQHSLAVS